MDGRTQRRFKDDERVCRALLEDESGASAELSVIDVSTDGAALTGAKDTTKIPRAGRQAITRGTIKLRVPSTAKKKNPGTKVVDVGPYEVVREWARGLGDDAGIAVRFPKPRAAWVKLMQDERFTSSLRGNA
ncbi:MAG: hypothetical protein JXQ73_28880 [Phycisphaerae bacterium]|nr:hypothetical protein [Phycisphaerae bacterium]